MLSRDPAYAGCIPPKTLSLILKAAEEHSYAFNNFPYCSKPIQYY